ncbi:hypothetical protein [Alkalibacillus silvisoli]|uniref:Bypass of forespore C C-terminal domain-containing protein n=1 Tax=Alkalibacillus silvisoli TaxID=392823 RepID=A0ABN0ZQV6_9BACI
MERIIVALSFILFLATWVVVITLFIDINQPTYIGKNHPISEEITISYKTTDQLVVFHELQTSTYDEVSNRENEMEYSSERSQEILNQMRSIDDSSLDPWREYFTDEQESNVSIDELIDIFKLNDEAVSES